MARSAIFTIAAMLELGSKMPIFFSSFSSRLKILIKTKTAVINFKLLKFSPVLSLMHSLNLSSFALFSHSLVSGFCLEMKLSHDEKLSSSTFCFIFAAFINVVIGLPKATMMSRLPFLEVRSL